jgi:hypothetical protein
LSVLYQKLLAFETWLEWSFTEFVRKRPPLLSLRAWYCLTAFCEEHASMDVLHSLPKKNASPCIICPM